MTGIYDQHRGLLATLDGIELVVAVFDSGYVPSGADTTLALAAGVSGSEVNTGDAPGYQRATFTAEWDPGDGALRIDGADQWPTFDLDGAPDVARYLFAVQSSDLLVCHIGLTAPEVGHDGWVLNAPDGIARYADQSAILARLDAIEARLDALENP